MRAPGVPLTPPGLTRFIAFDDETLNLLVLVAQIGKRIIQNLLATLWAGRCENGSYFFEGERLESQFCNTNPDWFAYLFPMGCFGRLFGFVLAYLL